MRLEVAIELIIPDNTAFTVLTALRHLGYANLGRVERSEHIALTVEHAADAADIVGHLSRAEVLFNPNKHRLFYAAVGGPNVEPAEYEATVRDKEEDNQRLLRLLTTTFGMKSLLGIERAVGWRLYDKRGPASRERLDWACRQLLSNTVSQVYEIHLRPVRRQLEGAASFASKTTQ